ncbi:MAG: hypothetical protein AB7H77_08915, partial [Bdellovibrionales bacterium]
MRVTVDYWDAGGFIPKPHQEEIESIFELTLSKRVGRKLGYDQRSGPNITISIFPDTNLVNGWCLDASLLGMNDICITVNPHRPSYLYMDGAEVLSGLTSLHLYEALRNAKMGKDKTLSRAIITRGLALNFLAETHHPVFYEYPLVTSWQLGGVGEQVAALSEAKDPEKILKYICGSELPEHYDLYPPNAGNLLAFVFMKKWLGENRKRSSEVVGFKATAALRQLSRATDLKAIFEEIVRSTAPSALMPNTLASDVPDV